MITKKLQDETRSKIVAARKAGDTTDDPRQLWGKLYGAETPAIEDFADVFRSVLAEEQKAAEADPPAATDKPADDAKTDSKKKA